MKFSRRQIFHCRRQNRRLPAHLSVAIRGQEGNKPFLMLVKQMNTRHINFAFRSDRIIRLMYAKYVFRSFGLEFYNFFRSSLKNREQFSILTLVILGEIPFIPHYGIY